MDHNSIEASPEWGLPTPNADAAYKSLGKYGKSEVIMTRQQIDGMNVAYLWMEQQFKPYMGNSRIVTYDEAVGRLDKSTSTGFPWNEFFKTKGDMFETDELREWFLSDWEALADDPNWTTLFSSSLKEELRPTEKILENSIRTFAAGAADATVQGNRLFVDMNEKLYNSHLKTASTVGMSPLKGNWDLLYQKLSVFDNGYALDESQYDSSLRKFLMWACARFRFQCLRDEDRTPENMRRVQTYYRNLVNTVMVTPDGILVYKKLGNPSGSVNTVSDNTLILYMLLAYAWYMLAPEDMKTYGSFEMNTAKALLGDDNTWTVSDDAHDFYNAVSVIDIWKSVGITTTTDDLKPRLPEDLDFLSAHTVFMKNIAVPLYSRDKLMSSLLYAPSSHLTPETTLQRCCNLLQIGWTDLSFRKFCRQLIDWLMHEYDDVLKDNPRWILAKCSIMSDETYFALFTGRKLVLNLQSLSGTEERTTPDKRSTMQRKPVYPTPKRTDEKKPSGGPKKRETVKTSNTASNLKASKAKTISISPAKANAQPILRKPQPARNLAFKRAQPKPQPKPTPKRLTTMPTKPQIKSTNHNSLGGRTASTVKPTNMTHRRSQIHDRLKKKSAWYDSIMSPITGAGVKIPDPIGTETGTYQHIENVSVAVNQFGVSGLKVVSPYINNYDLGNTNGMNYQVTAASAATPSNLNWNGVTTGTIGTPFETITPIMQANALSHRVVSASVIAQSETSTLNDAGEMCAFVTPFQAGDSDQSYNELQIQNNTSLLPINVHKPIIARWFPCQGQYEPFSGITSSVTEAPLNVSYQDFIDPNPPKDNVTFSAGVLPFEFGVVCTGLNPSVGTIRYQIVINYEFIPRTDTSMITTCASPVDPMEIELVESWVADAPITEVISQRQASSAPHESSVPEEPSGFGMIFNVFKELLPLM